MSLNCTNGDVLLLSTIDGGDIDLYDGIIELTEGFETAVYLSLFGGNKDDDGSDSTKSSEYWQNKLSGIPDNEKLTSRTQKLLFGMPSTSANLRLLNSMILLDLDWMKQTGISDEIKIDLKIPTKNRINISIEIYKNKNLLFNTNYNKNWIAQSGK